VEVERFDPVPPAPVKRHDDTTTRIHRTTWEQLLRFVREAISLTAMIQRIVPEFATELLQDRLHEPFRLTATCPDLVDGRVTVNQTAGCCVRDFPLASRQKR
jgi:hypothetical protein